MQECQDSSRIRLEDFHKFFNVFEIRFEKFIRQTDTSGFDGFVSVGFSYREERCTERFEINWTKSTKLDVYSNHWAAEVYYEEWLQKYKGELSGGGALGWGLGATIFSAPLLMKNVELVFVGIRCNDSRLQVPSSKQKIVRKDYQRD